MATEALARTRAVKSEVHNGGGDTPLAMEASARKLRGPVMTLSFK
jgi:hypothetical protein